MRLTLTYFAWVRERTGKEDEQIDLPDDIATVSGLMDHLTSLGPGYAAAFEDREVVRTAVNMQSVPHDHPVKDGDEVAFFPPMTGG